MRARLRPPKVEVFKEWFELPGRLVYWQILFAIRFLALKNPPSLRVRRMIANAVIYYPVVLYYCVVLCSAALIIVGKQHPRGTVFRTFYHCEQELSNI